MRIWPDPPASFFSFLFSIYKLSITCLLDVLLAPNRRLNLPQVNDDVLGARPGIFEADCDDLVEPGVLGMPCLELDARVDDVRVLLRPAALNIDVGAVARAQHEACIGVEGVGRGVAEAPITANAADGGFQCHGCQSRPKSEMEEANVADGEGGKHTRETGTLEGSTCDAKDDAGTKRSDANHDRARQACVGGA